MKKIRKREEKMIFNFQKISLFVCLIILVSLSGHEQKPLSPSNNNVAENGSNGYKWEKLLNILKAQNVLQSDMMEDETDNLSDDSDYRMEKRARSLFLGKRSAKPRNLFLG